MNCKEFQTMAVELARRLPADGPETGDALVHVADCADCRMRLAEERILTLRLHHASEHMYSCEIPARIDVAVFRALEERLRRQERETTPRVTSVKQGWIAGSVTAAAAAALLLFAGTNGRMAETPQSSPGDSRVFIRETAPVEFRENETRELAKDLKQETMAIIGNRAPKPVAILEAPPRPAFSSEPDRLSAENHAPESTGAEFIPIPLGGNPLWRQAGPIVRVEVSGAVLDSMGFPISGDLYGRRIQADLLLGEDGMARAIRFVR